MADCVRAGLRFGRATCTLAAVAAIALYAAASAAGAENIRLSNDIVPAPFGYEPVSGSYVVAETTPLYVSPYIYVGTVNNNKLAAGQPVNVIAKVRDYDWMLVGRNGVGIGYIPSARVAAAKPNTR